MEIIDKKHRSFLRVKRDKVNRDTIVWLLGKGVAADPTWGSGIHNLEKLGWMLHIRWLCLEKIDSSRVWTGLA
jgi:hypothetical protein